MTDPLHVTTGFTPTTWVSTGILGAILSLIAVIVKQAVPWRKMSISAGEQMREELNERLRESETKREAERAEFENEIHILRHQLNNVRHSFDMFVALLEANPERVRETLDRVSIAIQKSRSSCNR